MPKLIYICSPYKGNIKENTRIAKEISIKAFNMGYLPICLHAMLEATTGLKEKYDRPFIIKTCLQYLRKCEAMVVNMDCELSEGMRAEILESSDMRLKRLIYRNGEII